MPRSLPDGYAEATRAAYEDERVDHGVEWGRCFCGCNGQPPKYVRSNSYSGHLAGLPRKFLLGHNARVAHNKKRAVDYLLEDRGYTTPCWIFQGRLDSRSGYGHINRDGVCRWAHRYFYEQHKGAIPAGLVVDHLCARSGGPRHCVNPDHLEAVTHQENIRRGKNVKLSEQTAEQIRRDFAALAERYGVTENTIMSVVRGRSWR